MKGGRQKRCNRMERRARWGAGAGQGAASRRGDKGAPCPGAQRSGWSTGRLANQPVDVQMNTPVLSHIPRQTMFGPLLARAEKPSLSRLPASYRHRGAVRGGRARMGGGANSPNNIWGGVGHTGSFGTGLKQGFQE